MPLRLYVLSHQLHSGGTRCLRPQYVSIRAVPSPPENAGSVVRGGFASLGSELFVYIPAGVQAGMHTCVLIASDDEVVITYHSYHIPAIAEEAAVGHVRRTSVQVVLSIFVQTFARLHLGKRRREFVCGPVA